MRRVERNAGWALAGLVVSSAAVRFSVSLGAQIPWISPDEFVYALAGESLWEHGTLAVRGLAAPYTSLLTPAVVGLPIAALGLHDGIVAAQALQSLLMSLVAVPVYLWARRLVEPRFALAAAALSLLVPGLAYGGTLMTEAAFYPLALAALAAGARALEHPTVTRQGVFFAFVTLAACVRMQALVLVPTLVLAVVVHGAITGSWQTARRLAPIGVVAVIGAAAIGGTAAIAGSGTLWDDLLGAYRPVLETSTSVVDAATSIASHGVGVALVAAVLPLVATAVVVADVVRRRSTGSDAAYVAVAVTYLPLLVLQVGVFAAQNVGYVSQRYLVTAAPVLFVGFAVWLARGTPLPRLLVGATVAALVAGLALVPIADIVPNEGAHDALWTTWLRGAAASSTLGAHIALVLAAVALLSVLVVRGSRLAPAALAVIAVALITTSVHATRTMRGESQAQERSMIGVDDPSWLPSSADDVVLLATGDHPSPAVARMFFWNPAIRSVVRLPDVAVRVPPSPPVVDIGLDGAISTGAVAAPSTGLVLTPSTITLDGDLVAQRNDPTAEIPGWRLWRTEWPAHVTTRMVGFRPNGDFSGETTVLAPGCGRGALELTVLGKSGDPVVVTVDGIPWGEIEAPNDTAVSARIPAPPYSTGTHTCVFHLATEGFVGTSRVEFTRAG